jgi:solute carrier family 34 (sodium-dependent phosphate cotransporter)
VTAAAVPDQRRELPKVARVAATVMLLYLFLVGVKALETGIKAFGADFAEGLLAAVSNPVSAVCAGILATVLVQSSSVSTATIVGLVGGGALTLGAAVPMIMGANIGTTITSTLAALGSVRQGQEFRRAFAGATMHDFFNLLTVAVALPLELATGFLSRPATALTDLLIGSTPGGPVSSRDSLIKDSVSAPVDLFVDLLDMWGVGRVIRGTALLGFGLALIFFALAYITRNMRLVMAGRFEQSFNALLDRGAGVGAMALGLVMTVMVQSSSITTSVLVPMVAAGVLTLRNAFPVTLGANLGTTVTALLASLATDRPEALTVALVHTLFNVFGILVFYPVPQMRSIPLRLATGLATVAQRRKRWVAVYVVGVFIVLPVAGVFMLQ